MFYLRKDSIINNFKKYRPSMYKNCLKAVANSRYSNKVFYLNKTSFSFANTPRKNTLRACISTPKPAKSCI